MKYSSFFFLFSFAFFSSYGQITLTVSDFPIGGDTAAYTNSIDFDLDYTLTGADALWDYSWLNESDVSVDTFFNIGDAGLAYQFVFNNGFFDEDYQANYYNRFLNFAAPETDEIDSPISNPVFFTKTEDDRIEAVGIGLEIGSFEVPVKNDIIDVVYELPMNYGDENESNSFFELDLNPAYDGILRRYQNRVTSVDGWGEITTPYGAFDVIRTKAELNFVDSLRISIGDVTTWIELPTPPQTIYSWWANGQKIPILEVVTQTILGEEAVSSVRYKSQPPSDGTSSVDENSSIDLVLYPNPVLDDLLYLNSSEKWTTVSIYDLNGKLVLNESKDQGIQSLDLSHLSGGLYQINLSSETSFIRRKITVQ